MDKVTLPSWFRVWYCVNLVILPFDFLFIVLRPRSLASADGDFAYLFPLFQTYASLDLLFSDLGDPLLRIIYHICQPIDMLFILYLAVQLRPQTTLVVALLCVVEAVFCATKTFIYLCYSWTFLVPYARLPITIMNSMWVLVPLALSYKVAQAILDHCSSCNERRLDGKLDKLE